MLVVSLKARPSFCTRPNLFVLVAKKRVVMINGFQYVPVVSRRIET